MDRDVLENQIEDLSKKIGDAVAKEIETILKAYFIENPKFKDLPKEGKNLLSVPIFATELSHRVKYALRAYDITTIGDLLRYRASDLLKIRNLGKDSVRQIESYLKERGLSLAMLQL